MLIALTITVVACFTQLLGGSHLVYEIANILMELRESYGVSFNLAVVNCLVLHFVFSDLFTGELDSTGFSGDVRSGNLCLRLLSL